MRLASNKAYVVSLAYFVLTTYIIMGVFANVVRYVEEQFNQPAFIASIVAGTELIDWPIDWLIGWFDCSMNRSIDSWARVCVCVCVCVYSTHIVPCGSDRRVRWRIHLEPLPLGSDRRSEVDDLFNRDLSWRSHRRHITRMSSGTAGSTAADTELQVDHCNIYLYGNIAPGR